MPTYFQAVKGFSAFTSGVMILPIAAGLVVSIPLAGYLTSLTGYYSPFMLLTSIMTPPTTGLLTTLDAGTEIWKFVFFQALLGAGVGIGFQGPQVAVQAILSDSDALSGVAIIQLAQALGPAVALAGAQTIFASKFNSKLVQFLSAERIVELTSQGLTIPPGLSLGERTLVVSAYVTALNSAFILSLVLACLTIVGAVFMRWRKLTSISLEKA